MRRLTPPGLSGVAVVAFAEGERAALEACLRTPSGRPFAFDGRTAPRVAMLRVGGEEVDEALVVDRRAAGGEGVELHVHGAPAVLDLLRAAFPEEEPIGPSPADRLLREALSPAQLDLALEQRAFDFDAFLGELRGLPPDERRRRATEAIGRSRAAMACVEAHRVVLVGRQNAGKSTLFNKLLFRERALAGSFAGLTRDPVRERTALGGYPIELVDTAGEGEASAAVDARAIGAGRALREGATVLVLVDRTDGPTASDLDLIAACERPLVVANRADRPEALPWPDGLPRAACVSALCDDAASLRERFGELLRRHRALPPAGPVGGIAALTRDQLDALRAAAR